MGVPYVRPKFAATQFKPEQRYSIDLRLLNDEELAALERIQRKAGVVEYIEDAKSPDEYLDYAANADEEIS